MGDDEKQKSRIQLQFQIIPLRDFRLYKYTVDNQHLKVALYNGSKFIGCVGQVSYKIMGEVEPEIIKQVSAIADFALYAGVGRKTPMGMGINTARLRIFCVDFGHVETRLIASLQGL